MHEVTLLLDALDPADPRAAEKLLPLVYEELRVLAGQKLAHEKQGQTLQPTALVHEAYLRLAGPSSGQRFENRRHFFLAAAEAMRRILIERARSRRRLKRGGGANRQELNDDMLSVQYSDESLIVCHDALDRLEQVDTGAAAVVKLHVYLGLTLEDVAKMLSISPRTAYRDWQFARSWLYRVFQGDGENQI